MALEAPDALLDRRQSLGDAGVGRDGDEQAEKRGERHPHLERG
jgi:hypothetical protein